MLVPCTAGVSWRRSARAGELPQMCPQKICCFNEIQDFRHETVKGFCPRVRLFSAAANGGHQPPQAGTLTLKAHNYRSRKQNRIFQPLARFFLPGTLKNVPCALNKLLVKFRAESSGIGRFCRLEFQRMANWPSFDQKIKTGIIIRNRWPGLCNSPCSDQKIENQFGHPLERRACKIDQSH